MRFRFRYLGPDGGEVEVESLQSLRALVQSGTVGELTLLYDALTREWAPARAHAVYRLLRDETDPPTPAPATPAPRSLSLGDKRRTRHRGPAGAATEDPLTDLGLSLSFDAPHSLFPDTDEAVRAMMRERGEDDRPTGIQSFTANSWGSPGAGPAPAPAPPEPAVLPFATRPATEKPAPPGPRSSE